MATRFKAPAVAVIPLISVLSVHARAGQGKPQQDVIERLLPEGAIPKDLRVSPDERESIVTRLKRAQSTAHAQRAQQIAFLPAALDVEYERNRDYLLHVLSGCDYPGIRYDCDDMTGGDLIYLIEHDHREIIAQMLKASIDDYNAAGSEGIGAYFGNMVQGSPEKFLDAVSTLPAPIPGQSHLDFFTHRSQVIELI
jgi:hypothetical protein